jgi:hypothetical protein
MLHYSRLTRKARRGYVTPVSPKQPAWLHMHSSARRKFLKENEPELYMQLY